MLEIFVDPGAGDDFGAKRGAASFAHLDRAANFVRRDNALFYQQLTYRCFQRLGLDWRQIVVLDRFAIMGVRRMDKSW